MKNIIQVGNEFRPTQARPEDIQRLLKPAVYNLGAGMSGMFLNSFPNFELPEKVYGGHDEFANRVLTTFNALSKGMAVLLSGPKGCGKTLTAKQIGLDGIQKHGFPVIFISQAFDASTIGSFMENIPNRCIVMIDEFEKLYSNSESREGFLSLLDGAFENRHLFILTTNNPRVGEYFLNRPGRILYHKRYRELPKEILLEMVRDKVSKGKIRESLEKLVNDAPSISPDALSQIIRECLIHNETPDKFLSFFNVETEPSGYYTARIEAATLVPKTGLTKAQQRKAVEFLEHSEESGLYYARAVHGEGEKYTESKKTIFISEWCKPFTPVAEIMNPGSNVLVINHAANTQTPNRYQNFVVQLKDIKSRCIENGKFFFELHDGTKITLEKTDFSGYTH